MAKTKKKPVVLEEGIPGFDWSQIVNPFERMHKNSLKYASCDSAGEAFQKEYGKKVVKLSKNSEDTEDNLVLYVGKFIYVNVDEITHRGLKLSSPYIKEEIINKDDFTGYDQFKAFLLQNGNKVIGVVKELSGNKVKVDVLDAYYRLWLRDVEETFIKKEIPVTVYDLELTKGGFLGKVNIWTITQLLGVDYINTCFIPGSQIVLNIERNFENWIGKSVQVLPQKFTPFATAFSRNDNCLLCSRKQLLQYNGNSNLQQLWANKQLAEKMSGTYSSEYMSGTVTGVIKSSKKCGVFVELDGMYITGMLPCETYELANFKIGDQLEVRIKEFESIGDNNFIKNKNGNIIRPNMRVVFEL